MVQAERKVNRKTRQGTVVSSKNDQTVIVAVSRANRHRLYGKVIRTTKRYPVHDPENRATLGDLVVIEECRPISKTKHWLLVDVLTEREVAEVAPESIDETLVDEVQRTAARAAAEDADEAEASNDAEAPEAAADPPAAEAEAPSEAETSSEAEAEQAEPAPESEPVADEAADAGPEAEQADEERADS